MAERDRTDAMTITMTAAVSPRYGPPETIELRTVARPVPNDNEVLVRVRATSVGPADCAFRQGVPVFARLYSGLRKPRFPVLGGAVAGEVVTAGNEVERFVPGERVFGLNPKGFGAHAEYVRLPQHGLLAAMTDNMTYHDAVSVLDGATALTFLRDVAPVHTGQRVLINGASGAVGVFAVQLAKHFGAHVTGVCSTSNLQLVMGLGADEVIDYTEGDFTDSRPEYDIIFDAVGKSSFRRARRALTRHGTYLSTTPTLATLARTLWAPPARGRKAKFAATGLQQTTANLAFLAECFRSGALRPVVDRCYPLARIADAYRYVETGRKKGTVVITPP